MNLKLQILLNEIKHTETLSRRVKKSRDAHFCVFSSCKFWKCARDLPHEWISNDRVCGRARARALLKIIRFLGFSFGEWPRACSRECGSRMWFFAFSRLVARKNIFLSIFALARASELFQALLRRRGARSLIKRSHSTPSCFISRLWTLHRELHTSCFRPSSGSLERRGGTYDCDSSLANRVLIARGLFHPEIAHQTC